MGSTYIFPKHNYHILPPDTWLQRLKQGKPWYTVLEALLYNDVYLLPIHKMHEHPCWERIVPLMKKDKSAVPILIGYLEDYDVLGLWSVVLLPMLTGQGPPYERFRDELFELMEWWLDWAHTRRIEPI